MRVGTLWAQPEGKPCPSELRPQKQPHFLEIAVAWGEGYRPLLPSGKDLHHTGGEKNEPTIPISQMRRWTQGSEWPESPQQVRKAA